MSRPFVAQYHGTCDLCGDDVEPGDDVKFLDNEIVHLTCAEDYGDQPGEDELTW